MFVFLQFDSPPLLMAFLVVFFWNSKELRQGDHLFPLLFALVMDVFSRMLDKAFCEGRLLGFRVGNLEGNTLMISHLLFVDDTLLLCDVDLDQLLVI